MKLHHIAILTADLDASLRFWRDVIGLEQVDRKIIAAEEAEIAFLALGETLIELVQPLSEDGALARRLKDPGTKIHHLCIEVDDMDESVTNLGAAQIKMITDVNEHEDGTRYAFIHPRSAGGVLLELYETPG